MTDETRQTPAASVSHAWRCFHCDELFSDRLAAAEHFGASEIETPACKLNSMEGGLLGLVRRQAEQIDAYHREDTASYREFYSLGADHSQALRREEEKGYARGVADMKAQGFCVDPAKHVIVSMGPACAACGKQPTDDCPSATCGFRKPLTAYQRPGGDDASG